MTPGARPHDRENPGRVEATAKSGKWTGGRRGKMQQSRAGSHIAGNPLSRVGNAQMKNIDNEWFNHRWGNEAGLGLLLL
jgi:hypothetical protein